MKKNRKAFISLMIMFVLTMSAVSQGVAANEYSLDPESEVSEEGIVLFPEDSVTGLTAPVYYLNWDYETEYQIEEGTWKNSLNDDSHAQAYRITPGEYDDEGNLLYYNIVSQGYVLTVTDGLSRLVGDSFDQDETHYHSPSGGWSDDGTRKDIAYYQPGTQVTIRAQEAPEGSGLVFANWETLSSNLSLDTGMLLSPEISFVMPDQSASIRAGFAPAQSEPANEAEASAEENQEGMPEGIPEELQESIQEAQQEWQQEDQQTADQGEGDWNWEQEGADQADADWTSGQEGADQADADWNWEQEGADQADADWTSGQEGADQNTSDWTALPDEAASADAPAPDDSIFNTDDNAFDSLVGVEVYSDQPVLAEGSEAVQAGAELAQAVAGQADSIDAQQAEPSQEEVKSEQQAEGQAQEQQPEEQSPEEQSPEEQVEEQAVETPDLSIIRVEMNDGEAVQVIEDATVTAEVGSILADQIYAPDSPEGYHFTGWSAYREADGIKENLTDEELHAVLEDVSNYAALVTVPSYDMTLVACYEKDEQQPSPEEIVIVGAEAAQQTLGEVSAQEQPEQQAPQEEQQAPQEEQPVQQEQQPEQQEQQPEQQAPQEEQPVEQVQQQGTPQEQQPEQQAPQQEQPAQEQQPEQQAPQEEQPVEQVQQQGAPQEQQPEQQAAQEQPAQEQDAGSEDAEESVPEQAAPQLYNITSQVSGSKILVNGAEAASAQKDAVVTVTVPGSDDEKQFDSFTVTNSATGKKVADFTQTSGSFKMPEANVAISAVYLKLSKVKVSHGSGDGVYAKGEYVDIYADEADPGWRFDHWEIQKGDVSLDDEYESETGFIMPGGAVKVKAIYVQIKFDLTVENGSGDGSYVAGTKVRLSADWPASGKEFDKWVIVNGDPSIASPGRFYSDLTMPNDDVDVKAVYKNGPDPAYNSIQGIVQGGEYLKGTTITFSGSGNGMGNSNPNPGDYRYKPTGYRIGNVNNGWNDGKYETSMAINAAGDYTLTVIFTKEIFDGSSWVSDGTTDTKSVSFHVVNALSVKTGDNSPLIPLAIAAVAALIVIIVLVVIKIRRRK